VRVLLNVRVEVNHIWNWGVALSERTKIFFELERDYYCINIYDKRRSISLGWVSFSKFGSLSVSLSLSNSRTQLTGDS
jgi:hypothetical protein